MKAQDEREPKVRIGTDADVHADPLPAPGHPASTAWPPLLDHSEQDATSGRCIDTYRHDAVEAWTYPAMQPGFQFHVIHPTMACPHAPLYVVLHSAGHTSWTALQAGCRRSPDGAYNDHGLYHAPDDCYGLYLAGDSWWGRDVPGGPAQFAAEDSPVEKRVLETVAWVVGKYGIDPDRVHLAGISMGGSGALGIGMRHGDVFAAAMVWVPAGTQHVSRRMGFGQPPQNGLAIPDPPVVLNLSATNDDWSKGQGVLIEGCRERKYALIMGWGPFGHTGDTRLYARHCGAILDFPWLEIRRNQAYPVFTAATTDQRPPWLHPEDGGDGQGQINAWFRWQNVEDSAASFRMRLWHSMPDGTDGPATSPIVSVVVDLALRRLQMFRVPPEGHAAWEATREGRIVASGAVVPDASGLLALPRVPITREPVELRLTGM